MKKYEVQIRKEVKNDIEEIKDFIVEKTSKENAERYAAELYAEIASLAYLSDCIKVSEWNTAKKFSKREKLLVTSNKNWSILFHTYKNIVIIDKILPSKMIKN